MLNRRVHTHIIQKSLAAVLLAACFIFPAQVKAEDMILFYDGTSHVYTTPPIQLLVDGVTLDNLPMPPVIMNDRTLVPARETFEALGAVVSWNNTTREVYIGYNNKLVILQIDNPVANVDNSLERMDVSPKIINDKTMIPVRFASESLGLTVDWEQETRVVSVSNKKIPVSTAPVGLPQAKPDANTDDMPRDISTEKIPTQSYPQTQITDIIIPADSVSVFTISATSPITAVDTFPLAGNRIVLDINNAEMSTEHTTWNVGSSVVDKVRIAQNQTVPDMITRIVFDLNLSAVYRVTISPDRTKVYVIFESTIVNNVSFYSDSSGDYVDISLSGVSPVNVFHLTKPDRVVIDVPSSTISDIYTNQVSGHYTNEVRTNQFEAYTSRIVMELNQKVQHYVSTNGNTITVKLTEPTFKNITYDENAKLITLSKGGLQFSAADTAHYDSYGTLNYILTLPVDLSPVIGYGEYMAADEYLRSITIRNNSAGLTELVLNERRVLAVGVTDDNDNVYIKLLLPREVYSKIVVIDPGHGGNSSPGAIYNGLVEKDINLAIANKVMALFEQQSSIKAYATRTTDIDVDLSDRPIFGNEVGDLFVSIHNNAADRNPNANGTEAYYYPHDFEHTLWISGEKVAELLHRKLVGYLSSYERKVDKKDLAVTRESTIPAALLEVGFLSNSVEAAKLASDEYRQLAAQAIFDGIVEIFNTYTPPRP